MAVSVIKKLFKVFITKDYDFVSSPILSSSFCQNFDQPTQAGEFLKFSELFAILHKLHFTFIYSQYF